MLFLFTTVAQENLNMNKKNKIRKFLRFIGIKSLFDLSLFIFTVVVILSVLIFKVFPGHLGIDWSKDKREIIRDINLSTDEKGNKLSKQDAKVIFFKKIGKTDEQILMDEVATFYLHSSWIWPQILMYSIASPYSGLYNISLASTYFITHAMKYAVHKKRPDNTNYKSFPSGHSAGTMILAGFINKYFSFKVASPFYIAGSFIMWSRVYCNRHDWIDVFAGGIVGFLCGYFTNSILFLIWNSIRKKNNKLQLIHNFFIKEI